MLAVRHITTSSIREFAHDEHVETVVIMPSTSMAQARRTARNIAGRTRKSGLLVIAEDDYRLGFIQTANFVHAKTRSRYVVYVAQDAFAGFYWLERGIDALEDRNAGLLAFCDGVFFSNMAAFGLVRRDWTLSVYGNLLFYPRYNRHFGDVELTDIARASGKLVYNPDCVMVEVDYERFPPDVPEARHGFKNERKGDEETPDGILYVQRALAGFDGRIKPFVPTFGPVSSVLAGVERATPSGKTQSLRASSRKSCR